MDTFGSCVNSAVISVFRHPSTFYKKLIPKALTKMSGGTNGEERFSFPMVANTAEVYAF